MSGHGEEPCRVRLILARARRRAARRGQDRVPGWPPSRRAGPQPQPTLEELRWVARPLVVFADTPDDPRFVQQMRMLEAAARASSTSATSSS